MSEDAILVQRCLSGDAGGKRAFVEEFQQMVFGLCFRMLHHREDAEDIAQEVFIRIFRSLHTWDSTRPLKPWILTITANRCRTALEKRSRKPFSTDSLDHIADNKDQGDSKLIHEELQLGLDRLRPEYKECFVLFYLQELSCEEISQIMNAPVGTIKTWLHRARKTMAEHLKRRGILPNVQFNLQQV